MTRSIFDPGGRETERSGSTFTSAHAADRSKLPPDVTDGKVSPEEEAEAKAVAEADAAGLSVEERIEAIQDVQAAPDDDADLTAGTGGDSTPGKDY